MLIILEGVDGTGKSTLARLMSRRLKVPVIKPVGSPLTGMPVEISQAEDRGAASVACAVAETTDMIFDRWFPSEIVYGTALGRKYDVKAALALEREVSHVAHVMFLLLPPYNERIAYDRSGKDIPRDDYDRIRADYLAYARETTLNVHMIHPATTEGQWVLAETHLHWLRRNRGW